MAFDFELEIFLSGKPARTMQLLTDPELIRKWSGEEGIAEPKEGGKFEMFDGWVTGKVLKAEEKELVVTWLPGDWEAGTPPSEVHFLLKPYGAGTLVKLKHTGFPSEKESDSHKSGWSDFYFDPMEDFMLIIDKS
ncbi:hypothetical protein CJD36_010655 [Flavipsychrobacter stenotrophus]|uniref:Activator of Hsp90 ATPase homologue 1/2-like C-terminal domain-containing protein n=1 Tax=Flavipsychrobacter stenotrophus TaxID=2077091 RepID=A0A2S7SU39_9BACT|nr:SRPBCC domain-containing protein [Flavipsychrobacter stenotrophus]PQJ10430.1 hypothetical protein CJD36_010655 [Flavipsychrobacter stenotrophus]